jgi:hypothetical protein
MNLDELAKQYGGAAVSSTNLDDLAKQYGGAPTKPAIDENAKSAPFSFKDLALSAGSGGVGGIKALTDLFGATNAASSTLGKAQQAALAMKTPERQAEIARREAIKERAKGSTWEETKALLGGFAEAPLQETIEALTSSAPIIAASVLAPEAVVPAGLARLGMAGKAIQAAKSPATGIGGLMGLGGQKGQDYETVKREALDRGMKPEEAERLAQQASEYSLQNAPRQIASTATGALEGALGVENVLGKLGKAAPKVEGASRGIKAPTIGEAVIKNVAGEAAPEFIQAATGQLGSNQALNQAGIPTDMMSGVLSSAIHDAVVGGALGGVTSPAKLSELRKTYVQDQLARERETQASIDAGIRAEEEKLAKTKETFKQPNVLALPAPTKEIAPSIDEPVLVNPLGNITTDELGPEVTGYINKYRKDNGMPRLQSYSIEDIKDAMTAVNPKGEQAALDSILTSKTGFSGTEKYTPEDVINAAVEKNVATETKGFKDFLSRTTGNADLTTMSPPQLFSAFKALKDMPANETGAQIVLPEGTNASRFKPAQYKKALEMVGMTFDEMGGSPLSIDTIVKDIQDSTGLETERDARALLNLAIKNDDLAENRQVVFRTVKPNTGALVSTYTDKAKATAAANKQGLNVQEGTLVTIQPAVKPEVIKPRATLPQGYDIAETNFLEGEKPAGYNIAPEGRVKPLATVMEENDVPAKIERLQGLRRKEADKFLQDVTKHEGTVKRGRAQLEAMEARGELETEGYKKAQAQQARAEDVLGRRIASLLDRIEEYSAPLAAKPVGKKNITRKGFTVSKEGQKSGTFPTREAAEESILADLSDEALDALVSDQKFGGLQNRAAAEQNRRRSEAPKTGKKVSEVLEGMKPQEEKQTQETIEKTADLRAMLDKFGLKDVGVKIVKAIEEGADGSYAAKLVQIAMDAKNPIRTMRHEAMHALKELGFFTDAQWASLEKMAKTKWVDQYLKAKSAYLPDGRKVTRYEAYTLPKDQGGQGLTESEVLEEAIADAFGDFDASKAPPGMLTALLNKMRNFFDALGNYLSGRGFESYKDVFGKIEKGELKGTKTESSGTKLSLPEAPREFKLNLEKNERTQARSASLSESEQKAINKDAQEAGLSAETTQALMKSAIDIKKQFPVSQGWAPIEVSGLTIDENEETGVKTPSLKWQAQAYGYNKPIGETRAPQKIDTAWKNQVSDQMYKLVKNIYKRADSGDQNAQIIIGHQTWYCNVAAVLRREYGAQGDLLADILGATSPNTPVDTNWKFSVDILRRFMAGDFDAELRKFDKYTEDGGQPSKYPAQDKIRQISGKLYGMNSTNAMKALLDAWRVIEPGSAPKARNFALNLIGQSNIATIDVWAARMLRRAADRIKGADLPRIPPPAEKGVTGMWNASTTGITGEFGFGAAVMDDVASRLNKDGYDITPPDLQAIAWFAEKELWGKNRWTTTTGEGGSFEENIAANPTERYLAGWSIQQGEKVPDPATASMAQASVLSMLVGDESVVSARVMPTQGLYGNVVETSFDTEWTAKKGEHDPSLVMAEIAQLAKDNNQYDMFVSKVIGPNDSNPNARPGVEIYFKDKKALANAMPVLEKFTAKGQDGFTMAVDPRTRVDDEYIGVRLQYVPEISMRWDEDLGKQLLDPAFLKAELETKTALLDDIAAEVSEMEGVAYADVHQYDTVVVGKENYDDYIELAASEKNRKTGREVWFGEPIGKALKAAARRYGQEVGNGDVQDAGSSKAKLSLREVPNTPEFKQWFGKSKILYADDKTPRVMYHGTGRDITEFRGKQANAIFLSPDPEFAEKFSKDSAAWMSAHPEEFLSKAELAKGVKDATAAIRKDYRSLPEGKVMINSLKAGTYADATAEAQEYLRNAYKQMMPSGPNILPVYVSAQNPFDYQKPTNIDKVLAKLDNPDDYADALSRGEWNVIESDEVQKAIKDAGFDAFYVQEDGKKNLAVYKPEQIKSVTGNIGTYDVNNPDIRYSLRDATNMFDPDEVKKASKTEWKSRYKLINMSIDDFLRLAKFGKQDSKLAEANKRVEEGVKFTSIPYLYVDREDGNLRVTGHEGRHRAMALRQAGYGTMPVELRSNTRWSEQADPDNFDYEPEWFERIYAQEGALEKNFSIAMPFTREQAPDDYQSTPAKLSLRSIGDEIRSMPNGADIYDSIRKTTTKRDEKGFIQRMMDAISPESISSLRQKALNRYNQLGVYDKKLAETMGGAALLADSSAESAALLSDLAAGVTAAALGVHNRKGGIPVMKQGYTTVDTSVKGPTEIFRPLAAMGDPEVYQAYQFWAGAKRGSRFLADGKEELFTPAMVNYAKQLETKYPEFVQVQKEWVAYNDGLVNYMVDTGVLSKEKAAEFKRHGDYIPFYRQLDGEKTVGPNIFQSIAGVKAPKALKGSEAPLADFLETVVRNTQAAIQAGMKNTAAQRAVDVAVQIGEAKKLPVQSSSPDTVTVLRGGNPVSYEVADPLFIDAVKSLNLPELPFLGILSGPANLLRNLVTKDPGFMLANLMRDSMSAYVTSGANMLPVVDTIKNFGRAVQGADPAYQALLNAGLLGGYEFSQNIEASGEALAKDLRKKTGTQTGFEKAGKPFTSLWGALEKGTEASDAATRMAVYKDTLARTGNEAEALARALEVMNFNRKGSSAVVRVLTAAIPFLNARMQGLDVFYRASFGRMGNQDAKAIQKSFFVRGATLASLSVMYWALTHDDDDYKKQEQETKDNNWLIPSLGIKIPIPFEVGILFKVIPERIAAYAFGNDTGKDFSKSMGRALTSTFGIAPPQVVLPYLEAKTNYSFYTGRPIVGQGMEGVAPEFQVGPGTSPIFQKLGKELGASPMMLEHMYKGYTGSMGMYLVDLLDVVGDLNSNSPKASKRFEQMPVIKRFALDPEARGTVTSYYELKKSVDETVRTFNFLERTGKGDELGEYTRENAKLLMTRDFISSMDKDLKELQDMTVAVRNSPMESDAKRDTLTTLTRASNALTANIQNVRKAVE